jgi:DNA-directed RNA polymerase subunit N (RpoN/RPB10)
MPAGYIEGLPLVITLRCHHCGHVWSVSYTPGDIVTKSQADCSKCGKPVGKDRYVNMTDEEREQQGRIAQMAIKPGEARHG